MSAPCSPNANGETEDVQIRSRKSDVERQFDHLMELFQSGSPVTDTNCVIIKNNTPNGNASVLFITALKKNGIYAESVYVPNTILNIHSAFIEEIACASSREMLRVWLKTSAI